MQATEERRGVQDVPSLDVFILSPQLSHYMWIAVL